jgi:hypothetical protein
MFSTFDVKPIFRFSVELSNNIQYFSFSRSSFMSLAELHLLNPFLSSISSWHPFPSSAADTAAECAASRVCSRLSS